ncbi:MULTISPECIES: hypothetical protein [Bacteroides]|uniref:hypothetical protein n=1 Tax=Bacteroides TaxID=816 RepID=UPI001E5423A2|nr:hypothetical protein [Bacteroides ovatus]MCM1807003.1 hypothetical protein [Bacteroides ovatus]MCS2378229.1 hypothetical protein [Bacteroides ovatus]MCS2570201.1 hypothetical protein [Bacteroides ovatus]MCS3252294.1 hypothetical protein [Bacteroides ovatus]MDC2687485.1 hypothetical protein [Bacteroides ovatus]
MGEKFLSTCQGNGGEKEANQQCQRNSIIRTGRVGDRGSFKARINLLYSMKIGQLQAITVCLCRTNLFLLEKRQGIRVLGT